MGVKREWTTGMGVEVKRHLHLGHLDVVVRSYIQGHVLNVTFNLQQKQWVMKGVLGRNFSSLYPAKVHNSLRRRELRFLCECPQGKTWLGRQISMASGKQTGTYWRSDWNHREAMHSIRCKNIKNIILKKKGNECFNGIPLYLPCTDEVNPVTYAPKGRQILEHRGPCSRKEDGGKPVFFHRSQSWSSS